MSIGSPIQFSLNRPAHAYEAALHPVFSGRRRTLRREITAMAAHSSVFSCSISRANGRVAVEIIGEIDRTSAGQFRNQLLTLAKEHPVAIAIDMKQVALPDEAAVAVLVEAWRFAQEHGIELAVTSPSPEVMRTFDARALGPAPHAPHLRLPGNFGVSRTTRRRCDRRDERHAPMLGSESWSLAAVDGRHHADLRRCRRGARDACSRRRCRRAASRS